MNSYIENLAKLSHLMYSIPRSNCALQLAVFHFVFLQEYKYKTENVFCLVLFVEVQVYFRPTFYCIFGVFYGI